MGEGAATFRNLFPHTHIPVILSSVLKAGKTLRKTSVTELENKITVRLLKELVRIPEFRDGPLDIRPQTGILPSGPDSDHLEGVTDLLVSCGLGHEVYFVLEAKRLRYRSPNGSFKSGNAEYVKDGMMRFVTGQYAPLMETSAMLGYVFDGEIDKARSGIDKHILGKAKELKLRPPERLVRSPTLYDKPVDETCHDLKTRLFTIYHIFLRV